MPRWMVKALAVIPALAVSTVVTSMVGATLPPVAGLALFVGGLVTGVLLLAGVGEPAAARVLLASRPARAEELDMLAGALTVLCRAQLGPPVIRLRVRPGEHSIAAGGFGRRTVVVSAGLVDAVEDGRLPQDHSGTPPQLWRGGWVRSGPVRLWSLPGRVTGAWPGGGLGGAPAAYDVSGMAPPRHRPSDRRGAGGATAPGLAGGHDRRHRRGQLRDAGPGAALAPPLDRGGRCRSPRGRPRRAAGSLPAPLSAHASSAGSSANPRGAHPGRATVGPRALSEVTG